MPSFRPSAHGWPFADDYDCPAALIGLGRPVDPEFGFAGGMCWAALDRFMADRRVPRTTRAPGPEDSLYAEFVLRLSNVLAKDVVARAWDAQRLPAAGRGRTLGKVSRAEWASARRELDAERPVLLLLIKQTGPFADPTGGRFVLATRYDADAERAMVWTYDPRRPGDDAATLMLDPGKGGAAFTGRLGREEDVLGLIAIPYDRPIPPAIVTDVSPKDERQRVGLEEDLAPVDLGAGTLGLLARDTESHLVVVRHGADGWLRERPADLGDVGADFRFEGAPVPAGVASGRPSAVVRGVNGHLLHLRKTTRGWSAEDLTDQPNTGLRFRIAGAPIVLRDGRRPEVLALNADGRLLRYVWSTVRGWAAENVSKESGAEAGARLDGAVAALLDSSGRGHVVGRNADGELVHFREEPDGRWRGARPGAARAEIRRLLMEGPPVAHLAEDGAVEVYARGVGGHLLRFRLPEGGRWTGQNLTEFAAGGAPAMTLASEPCVAGSAGGMRHVLGRNADGDVVHFAGDRSGGWTAANLTSDRITVGPAFRVEGQPSAAAGGRSVVLAGRRGAELILYRWHGGGDWTAENLTVERGPSSRDDGPRIASDPLVTRSANAAHVVALSAAGTPVHYRVVTPMGAAVGASAAPASVRAFGSVRAIAPAIADFLRGIVGRFREPEQAGGLRASRLPRDRDDGEAEEPVGPDLAARLADLDSGPPGPGSEEASEAAGGAVSGAGPEASEEVKERSARDRAWGHGTSAPAPWHDGDLGQDAAEESAAGRRASETPALSGDPHPGSGERDLLREGSEWSGPRLVPEPGPQSVDDWDLALEEVATAHERALVEDRGDEVVDDQDPAAARIFLSGDEAGDLGGAGSEAAIAPTEWPEPGDSGPNVPAGKPPAARESSTETVPGRPLVDLSFLSDIVQPDAEADEAGARGAPGASPAPATSDRPASSPAGSDRPASSVGGPGNGAPAGPPASRGTGRTAAAPRPKAGWSAAEPTVDLEFLATAAEYLGGGEPAEDLSGFLRFLEHG